MARTGSLEPGRQGRPAGGGKLAAWRDRLRWFWRRGFDPSWRLDETYVKVRGKWTYLYRAVDKRGDTIDFYLSPTRSAKAAKRFLGKALRALRKGQARPWCLQPGIRGEVRLVERAFGIGPSALTEAMDMLNHHFAAAA